MAEGHFRSQVKEGSTAFLKKSSKKLLLIWAIGVASSRLKKEQKFFGYFFSKK
jgi:hypothetical protein